jgi:stage II sporulation protein D
MWERTEEPKIAVGIVDGAARIEGRLDGTFLLAEGHKASGRFSAHAAGDAIALLDEKGEEVARSGEICLEAQAPATFALFDVLIGKRFHWERPENQTFRGNLLLRLRQDGTMAIINEIPLEEYLRSVVSSEMSAASPLEFLKAHAIISRSWLLAALAKKGMEGKAADAAPSSIEGKGAVIRWYNREEHDLFDVCADDHCQRYQGLTKIISGRPEEAVSATRGTVLTYGEEICDARFSKACGGLTEDFATAWEGLKVPYLTSVPDSKLPHPPIETEAQAREWILSSPEAYCRLEDEALMGEVLPGFDRETKDFFRWKVVYSQDVLSALVQEKSGLDLGTVQEFKPLLRGPSGRICRLGVTGSKGSVIVGKELEIRRWLSPTHLLSSAFVVDAKRDRRGRVETFTLHGAGWGHGVGLCQIGASVMAFRGFAAAEILTHYFTGARIRRIYK